MKNKCIIFLRLVLEQNLIFVNCSKFQREMGGVKGPGGLELECANMLLRHWSLQFGGWNLDQTMHPRFDLF